MCGQPELHDLLAQPELRQLKQRVSLKCSIKMFNYHETTEYIRWRLRVAGATRDNLFEAGAVRMIHQFSGGIPRIINNICDNALLTGFSDGSQAITSAIIEEVVEVLDLTGTEITSAATAGQSAAAHGFGVSGGRAADESKSAWVQALPPEQPQNVRYIRPDLSENAKRVAQHAAVDKTRFVLDAQDEDTPLKFFSRVRATKG